MSNNASSLCHRLAGYLHDCLAAQTDWGGSVNVLAQNDVEILPLRWQEQEQLNTHQELDLDDAQAIEFGKLAALASGDSSLCLGALFLVGRRSVQETEKFKSFCAPVLEVPVEMVLTEGGARVRVTEREFTVNHSLLAEILDGDDDDLQDRLADLSDIVPDFPIDEKEMETFWERFQEIAPEVHVSSELPKARKNQGTRIAEIGSAADSMAASSDAQDSEPGCDEDVRQSESGVLRNGQGIEMVDFFFPQIAGDGNFRLLPSTAVVTGANSGHSMSSLSELRAMQDMHLEDTAFGAVFDPDVANSFDFKPHEREFPDEVRPLPLTPAQAAIVESARSAPLTVVTGPPGTGKSYTIGAIMLDAIMNGQTVLLASQMEKAVEVVARNVESIAGPLSVARSGGRKTQRELAAKIGKLTGPKNNLGYDTQGTVQQLAQNHFQMTREEQGLKDGYQNAITSEERWSQLHGECMRCEPLLPFETMKVSAKHARKADALLKRIENHEADGAGLLRNWWVRYQRKRIARLLQIPLGESLPTDRDLQLMISFYSMQAERQQLERRLKHPFLVDLIWDQILQNRRTRHRCAIDLLRLKRERRLKQLVDNQANRTSLRNLSKLLRRRDKTLKSELKQEVKETLLTDAFPGWASTNRALCEVLPTKPAFFDVVVIDEASQCDLALAAVALMRGKRAVVVGDPNQLRHVCFLSRTREQAYFSKNGITSEEQRNFHFRRSLFDVAADAVKQEHFFLLDEHFRSEPAIISFSNRKFYDGDLKIMTGRPGDEAQSAIAVIHVDGIREKDSSINLAEVDATIQQVESWMDKQDSGRPLSIGVVSPFRDHADEIQRQIVDRFTGEQINQHQLTVGTAHTFQGDEKDVIVFSTSIDGASHRGSLQFLENPNLFNVAITRARKKLVVVTSMTTDALPQGLLREFLQHADGSENGWTQSGRRQSPFERQLCSHLEKEEMSLWTGFDATGTCVPIVAGLDDARLAVLCDADRDGSREPWQQLEEQLRLSRAGWNTTRIPHRTFVGDPDAVAVHVRERLKTEHS